MTTTLDSLISRHQLLSDLFSDVNWWERLTHYIPLAIRLEEVLSQILAESWVDPDAALEENVTIKDPVVICENAHVRAGTYIIGPAIIAEGATIGPNCFLRGPLVIGPGCIIGHAAEVKASILLGGARVLHFSFVGNSIIGRSANVGAGTITAVRRFDNQCVNILTPTGTIATGRRKFGAIIGDNAQIGIGVLIYPGRLIGPGCCVNPGSKVRRNLGHKGAR